MNLSDAKKNPRIVNCEAYSDFVVLSIVDNTGEIKITLTLQEFDKLTKEVFKTKEELESY